jgi:hypothetical protein
MPHCQICPGILTDALNYVIVPVTLPAMIAGGLLSGTNREVYAEV